LHDDRKWALEGDVSDDVMWEVSKRPVNAVQSTLAIKREKTL
jgi:hypothetical protein